MVTVSPQQLNGFVLMVSLYSMSMTDAFSPEQGQSKNLL